MASLVSCQRHAAPCAPIAPAPLNEISFCAWVAQAELGEVMVYHRGFLVVDTDKLLSDLSQEDRQTLRRLADAAFRAAQQDLVHLVQTRLAIDRFTYMAIARPKPRRSGTALSMRLLEAA